MTRISVGHVILLVLTAFCFANYPHEMSIFAPQSDVSHSLGLLSAGGGDHGGADGQDIRGGHLLLLRAPGDITLLWSEPSNTSHQEDDLARVLDNGTCSVPHHAQYCGPVDWCVKTWRGNSRDNMTGDTRDT